MLISTPRQLPVCVVVESFNPSTGLMLISTSITARIAAVQKKFQSLDWVDVDFDHCGGVDLWA